VAETISEERIAQAWCAVIGGNGSRDDTRIMLAELKEVTGYYMVTASDAPDSVRAFNDGGRRVYAHLLARIARDPAAVAVEREARLIRAAQQGTKSK
jgi:hypothetical protein